MRVNTTVGGNDVAQPFFHSGKRRRQIAHAALQYRLLTAAHGRRGANAALRRVKAGLWLLFAMLCPAAQHRIEAQAQKGGDKGQNNNFNSHTLVPLCLAQKSACAECRPPPNVRHLN